MSTDVVGADGVTVWDSPNAEAFRGAMGLFPTGIAVITVGQGPGTEAMTASSVTSISLEPTLVLVSVNAAGPTGRRHRQRRGLRGERPCPGPDGALAAVRRT